MANIDPKKLTKNFKVLTQKDSTLELYFDAPTTLSLDEELIVVRRNDAFPVELRNVNYEDRYTDVAQVEVYRAGTIYCSHLIPNNNELVLGSNTFTPSFIVDFERDNVLTGRLIRDSNSQVFRITGNTAEIIYWENISSNPANQATPVEGAFIILPDFPSQAKQAKTVPLLRNTYSLQVVNNSFTAGDKVTIRTNIDLEFGVHWFQGMTTKDTALSIQQAIISAGVQYTVQLIDDVVLINKGLENTLAVSTNTANIEVLTYSAARGKFFVEANQFSENELVNTVVVDAFNNNYFIRSNIDNVIQLYDEDAIIGDGDVYLLNSFNNTYPAGYKDNFKNYLEALKRRGTGLTDDQYYFYTVFTAPVLNVNIVENETALENNEQAPFLADKISASLQRVFYEKLQYRNNLAQAFSYDALTGEVTYAGSPDLSSFDIQVGDLFADSEGRREVINDISQLSSGIVGLATGLTINESQRTNLHGSITRAVVPVGIANVQPNDTFKDISGASFEVAGTNAVPYIGVTTPPANSFDVFQGLIDDLIMRNDFLIPYSYDPATGLLQYGEQVITRNSLLTNFTYNGITGVIQYTGPIQLNSVQVGDYFIDGANNQFEIKQVIPLNSQIVLDTLLSVDNTVVDNRDGSVVRKVDVEDVEGNPLVDLRNVLKFDLFKTNAKALLTILDVDAINYTITVEAGISNISTLVDDPFDASIVRKGKEVVDVGFNDERLPILVNLAQGSVKRYNSLHDAVYAGYESDLRTQSFGLNPKDRQFGALLYQLFPQAFRMLDESGELEDLTNIFGHEFNTLYGILYRLEMQNANYILPTFLGSASGSLGVKAPNPSLGIDTRRRVIKDLIPAYKLKGTRDGIAKYIKILTTWDITNGTGDLIEAIIDDTPETVGLRFYSPSLGPLNTRLADTAALVSPPAGRFYKGPAGITLPGFFTAREVIINLPNVAMEIGLSTALVTINGTTVLSDIGANFGVDNGLSGCYIIPNEGAPNDFYKIIANTATTLTVEGVMPADYLGAKYVVLSPLNTNRFIVISDAIVEFMPYNTKAIFNFELKEV